MPEISAPENTRVLVVDDQDHIHADFEEMLARNKADALTDELVPSFLDEAETRPLVDFELLHATTGEAAVEAVSDARAASHPITTAFIDIRMPPGIDGIETVRRIRRVDRDIELVLMTAYTDKRLSDVVRSMELLHKLLYIRKPFAREEMQQITLALVTKWNLEQSLAADRELLAASHHRLEAVLDATGDAIAMFDQDGRRVFANRWFEQLHDADKSADGASPVRRGNRSDARFRTLSASAYDGEPALGGGELVEYTAPDKRRQLFLRSRKPMRNDRAEETGDLVVLRDVSKEIEIQQMRSEVRRLRTELDGQHAHDELIGTSAPMVRVRGLMRRATDGDLPVLIVGESGTGKELVARSLHFNGPRSKAPFVAVNCAGLPATLIESELFGYERGAFTGAYKRRIGAFERAHGGTIFLDEVGDMDPALQGSLLRVIQTRHVERIGGTDTIPLDFQLVSATNKDLEAAIRNGEFREDLYYRIATFPIPLPPLRDRPNDIPELAKYFLDIAAKRAGKQFQGFSQDALATLLQHDWPGNVRELENAISRAVLIETDAILRAKGLAIASAPGTIGNSTEASGAMSLAEIERNAIMRTLEMFNNNISRSALALGISRSTLHRKLDAFSRR